MQQLENEFKVNESKIKLLESYVEKYKKEGKLEAASRLKDQSSILEVS
jgi:hypothetical protein